MEEKYYAVTREEPDDLQHWKYIKKKKVKGKWKYIYDKSEIDKFNKGYKKRVTKNDSKNQEFVTTKKYKKTDDFFSSKSTKKKEPKVLKKYKVINRTSTETVITYKQGKLDRWLAKGEKFIFDKFLKNKTTKKPGSSAFSKLVNKGKAKINKILKKTEKTVGKKLKKHKYVEKIKMPNGTTRYFYNKDEYNAYIKRLNYQKNEPEFMKKIKKIDKNTSMLASEDMIATNPKYDPYDDETSMNCYKCTIAYELRRRGYDVEAAPFKGHSIFYDPQTTSDIDKYFKDPNVLNIKEDGTTRKGYVELPLVDTFTVNNKLSKTKNYSSDDIKKALKNNNPKNSRGMLNVSWRKEYGGSGHSMVYEINDSGDVVIRDAQTNDVRDIDDLADMISHAEFVRTDNLELKKAVLRNVRNRK